MTNFFIQPIWGKQSTSSEIMQTLTKKHEISSTFIISILVSNCAFTNAFYAKTIKRPHMLYFASIKNVFPY